MTLFPSLQQFFGLQLGGSDSFQFPASVPICVQHARGVDVTRFHPYKLGLLLRQLVLQFVYLQSQLSVFMLQTVDAVTSAQKFYMRFLQTFVTLASNNAALDYSDLTLQVTFVRF